MTQVYSVNSRHYRLLRALAPPHQPSATKPGRRFDLTSEQLLVARHMARDNYSSEKIYKALNLKNVMTLHTMRQKLKAVNIRPGSFKIMPFYLPGH